MRSCILSTFFLLLVICSVQAQISGVVFRDYNANGTRENTTTFTEPGVQGITVTAYPPSGSPNNRNVSSAHTGELLVAIGTGSGFTTAIVVEVPVHKFPSVTVNV